MFSQDLYVRLNHHFGMIAGNNKYFDWLCREFVQCKRRAAIVHVEAVQALHHLFIKITCAKEGDAARINIGHIVADETQSRSISLQKATQPTRGDLARKQSKFL